MEEFSSSCLKRMQFPKYFKFEKLKSVYITDSEECRSGL